jgi:hypothetical protein
MLELVLNNEYILEIAQESIKYTMQNNDIADLESRQCSFTNSFSVPKTFNNVNYFKQLGLVGDVSDIPYKKVTAMLLENGIPLITNGWLEVKETTNEYKIFIRDGSIDLFKAFENKTFGDDVDLSEIDHSKDLNTIINSFTNENYRYIINDYGGKTHTENGTKINADYLVPCVRVKYLWDKTFSTFGFNYLGDVFKTFDFEGLWLTYPKAPPQPSDEEPILYAELNSWRGNEFLDITLIQGTLIDNAVYVVPTSGSYKITLVGYLEFENQDGSIEYVPLPFYINGNETFNAGQVAQTFNINLNQGDLLNFQLVGFDPRIFGYLIVEKYATEISFSEELKQLKITDFFKEILWRFALTIFIDKEGNYIFKTFDERLQANIIDWSEKYKERNSETYVPNSYAQQNRFREDYRDERFSYNDGLFFINNKNLKDEYTVIKSQFFTHDRDFESFLINSTTNETFNRTELWEKEVSENQDVQEIKYKELSSRFYLLRTETISKSSILKSEALGLEQSVSSLPVARFLMTAFKDFVPKYYANIQLLLNDFRFHKMKLAICSNDVHNLDFDKIYYFEQEQNYYFLNKINYENGKISTAEFYRIKYAEQ